MPPSLLTAGFLPAGALPIPVQRLLSLDGAVRQSCPRIHGRQSRVLG